MNTTSIDIGTDEAAALLRTALVEMVGESDPAKLKRMIIFIRNTPAPEEEKTTIINAIDALLRTQNIKSQHIAG